MENAFVAIVPTRPCPLFGRPVHRRDGSHRFRPGASPQALRIPPRSGHPALPNFHRGQRDITPAFGYGALHPSTSGTPTHLSTSLPSAHYEPVRLPAAAVVGLWIPPRRCANGPRTTPDLPGPFTVLSTRALPIHPGQPDACAGSLLPHRLQASSPSEDWPLPLASRGRIGFAVAGLTSSLAPPFRGGSPAASSPGRTDPFRVLGYPPTPGRSYMSNEQFTWLTPRSQQARCGLPWRNRRTRRRHQGSVTAAVRPVAPRRRRGLMHKDPQRQTAPALRLLVSAGLCASGRRPVGPARDRPR